MKQYYSQWGEDKILEEIFEKIGHTNRIALDVGAWDGEHFSNTLMLAENYEFSRILCEANEERLNEALSRNFVARFYGKVENIDSVLALYKCPTDIDLLSIDVDGDDYYLWQDMVKYRPRVVVIEYNQTVPPHIDIKQERGGSFGASARALELMGKGKGYKLLTCTVTNMIFIDEKWYYHADNFVNLAFYPYQNTDWLQYIVTGYNGKQYLIGEPAHNDNQGGKHEKLITDVKYKNV